MSKPSRRDLRSLLLVFCFQVVFLTMTFGQGPTAVMGILDASQWNFANDRIALNGDWMFYENKLLSPLECQSSMSGIPSYFPKIWNEPKPTAPPIEFGTYSLKIVVPWRNASLAMEMPAFYSSYSLWVNDSLIATNGAVGKTPETTKPQWRPQTVSFKSTSDTLRVVLQIANFHHSKSGCKDPIYLGGSDMMEHSHRIATSSNLMEAIILGIIGIIFLFIWRSERKKVVLYFTLLCFTWAIRSVFSNLYLFVSFVPDFSWNLTVRIEYITLYLTMIWTILFLNRLFPQEGNDMAKYLLVGVNILFVVCALFFSPAFFTRLLPIYLAFCGFLLVYGLYIVVRAWVNEHAGVWFSILSILLGLAIFTYDMFAYEGLFAYSPVIFGLGYVIIFLSVATSLLLHLNILKSSKPRISVLTYNDLYKDQPTHP